MKRRNSHDAKPLTDEELLAIATFSAAGEASAVTPDVEAKLMASFGKKARVGASTTGAGTQIVELESLPHLHGRPANGGARNWMILAAAVVLLTAGWTVVRQNTQGPSTAGQIASLGLEREKSGGLRLSGVSEPMTVVVHGIRADGTPIVRGPVLVGVDGRIPEALTAEVSPARAVRVTRSTADGPVLFDGIARAQQ